MVTALFTLTGGLERARRHSAQASALALLEILTYRDAVRPSEIATQLGVHQSSVTRQVRTLEAAGYVSVAGDAQDRRACVITLTQAGRQEAARLHQVGLSRFEAFVADWEAEEVRTLGRLLLKLEESKAEVARREQVQGGRRWQQKG